MYWKVGEFLSKETEHASYGDAYIDEISREIQETFPGIKGFNRRGLYRMKKFYETFDSGKQNGFRHNGGKRGTKC